MVLTMWPRGCVSPFSNAFSNNCDETGRLPTAWPVLDEAAVWRLSPGIRFLATHCVNVIEVFASWGRDCLILLNGKAKKEIKESASETREKWLA